MKTRNFNPNYWLKRESNQKFGKIVHFSSFPNNSKILERIKSENLTEITVFVYENLIKVKNGYIIGAIGFSNENFSNDLDSVFLSKGYKNQIIRCSKLTMTSEDYLRFSNFCSENRIYPYTTEDELILKFNPKIEVLEQKAIVDVYDIY
jgi:hypothetical protein